MRLPLASVLAIVSSAAALPSLISTATMFKAGVSSRVHALRVRHASDGAQHQVQERDSEASTEIRVRHGYTSADGWKMRTALTGQSFIDYFHYDVQPSDNEGVANYVDGTSSGLVWVDSQNKIRIAVDGAQQVSKRNAVRMVSSETYNPSDELLFIFDIKHIPAVCGTWPAVWFTGANWPDDGEIDVVEGVNKYSKNTMSIHSGSGCKMSTDRFPAATLIKTGATNCDAYTDAEGCGVSQNSNSSFGVGSNIVDGSTYALKYTTEGVFMWQWNTGKGPEDITNGEPTPSTWGEATVSFSTSTCDMNSHFKDLMLVVNTNLGGFFPEGVWDVDYAGGQTESCAKQTSFSSAYDYVRGMGEKFGYDAEWVINGFYIFEQAE